MQWDVGYIHACKLFKSRCVSCERETEGGRERERERASERERERERE